MPASVIAIPYSCQKLFAFIASAAIDPLTENLWDLEVNSPALQEITFRWKNVYTNPQIASCYELETTNVNIERLGLNVERWGVIVGHFIITIMCVTSNMT